MEIRGNLNHFNTESLYRICHEGEPNENLASSKSILKFHPRFHLPPSIFFLFLIFSGKMISQRRCICFQDFPGLLFSFPSFFENFRKCFFFHFPGFKPMYFSFLNEFQNYYPKFISSFFFFIVFTGQRLEEMKRLLGRKSLRNMNES